MIKKIVVNCFLFGFLVVMLIDTAPETCDPHRKVKAKLDYYLDKAGLWQGTWNLFAPNPDSVNSAITAEVGFADGTIVKVRSPDWRKLSAWQRLVTFRESEFMDDIRLDSNSVVWTTYAEYLQRTVEHPTDASLKPVEIVMIRDWVDIAPPNEFNIKEFPEPPEMSSSFIFFAEEYGQ